tara:strand:- start:228 stop:995 length:768 start_codon:yes stop_codon:yes gene_type:complete
MVAILALAVILISMPILEATEAQPPTEVEYKTVAGNSDDQRMSIEHPPPAPPLAPGQSWQPFEVVVGNSFQSSQSIPQQAMVSLVLERVVNALDWAEVDPQKLNATYECLSAKCSSQWQIGAWRSGDESWDHSQWFSSAVLCRTLPFAARVAVVLVTTDQEDVDALLAALIDERLTIEDAFLLQSNRIERCDNTTLSMRRLIHESLGGRRYRRRRRSERARPRLPGQQAAQASLPALSQGIGEGGPSPNPRTRTR